MPPFRIFGRTLASGRALLRRSANDCFSLLLAHNLTHSRFGRALAAIRQSETAAEAMGIDVLRYKAVAFAASGFLGAIGGGLLASLSTYLDPAQYGITQSVYFLAIAVVGGMSSSIGALLGSAVFVASAQFLAVISILLGPCFRTFAARL